tara:strand:+ start:9664 stop:10155 length:492 start_codon:yes stop_codon:yes gene_type:complete
MELATPHDFEFELGAVLRCKITGFEGVLVTRTQWLANCNTYSLKPQTLKDGLPQDSKNFDEPMLELVKGDEFNLGDFGEFEFELGSVLKDKVTGFKGVVTARSQFISDCNNYCLKPQELKDGIPIDVKWFDEPLLAVVKSGSFEVPPDPTGGPERDVPTSPLG